MKASELLSYIHGELNQLSEYISLIEIHRATMGNSSGIISIIGDYNYAIYKEISQCRDISPDFMIDTPVVENFRETLHDYFQIHAPGKTDLYRYVSCISLYLMFIAKRPLHPPEIRWSDEKNIEKEGQYYYCSVKQQFLDEPSSLCRYCVCRPR